MMVSLQKLNSQAIKKKNFNNDNSPDRVTIFFLNNLGFQLS